MPGHVRTAGKIISILGVEGKKVDIIPTTSGMNYTELYCKKEPIDTGYMGAIAYCLEWKKYVLVDLHKDFQMSKDCIDEAFKMTQEYWGDRIPSLDALPKAKGASKDE